MYKHYIIFSINQTLPQMESKSVISKISRYTETSLEMHPDDIKSVICSICNTEMTHKFVPKRQVRGICAAMSGIGWDRHEYTCQHSMSEWHIKAEQLTLESQKTASTFIRNILQKEIDEIMMANIPNKLVK